MSRQKSMTEKYPGTGKRGFARLMALPTVIVLAVMTVYPLIFTVFYSFTDYQYGKKTGWKFVSLKNYAQLLTTPYFQTAVLNTIKFTVLAVFFEMVFGVLVAVFVNSLPKKTQKPMRILLLLPYLFPTVTIALSWKMMLSQNYGIVNHVLTALGLPVHNWFMETGTAFNTILLIDVWQNVPFVFLLVYAGLQSVPKSQYEAAELDGAGVWTTFWHVTVPNIRNELVICAMLRTIDTFRLFDKVNILTGGGPAGTTSTITQYLFNYGIKNLKFGFGSAGAIIMTLLVLVLSFAYIRRMTKQQTY